MDELFQGALDAHLRRRCVDTARVDEAARAATCAQPGEWYLRTVGEGAAARRCVTRFDGTEVTEVASVLFMAKARGYVPMLVSAVRGLIEALTEEIAASHHHKQAWLREQRAHAATAARGGAGRRIDDDVTWVVNAIEHGACGRFAEQLVIDWANGKDVGAEARRACLGRPRLADELARRVAQVDALQGRRVEHPPDIVGLADDVVRERVRGYVAAAKTLARYIAGVTP